MADGSDDLAAASFRLPASPSRSPTGGDMSVWVEDAGGEQRVHVELLAAAAPPASAEVVDFPLILCDSSDGARAATPSSAIVPFQKLQLDTNLNQTLLPYRSTESPSAASAPSSPSARRKAQQLASSFLAMEHEASAASIMSSGFMTALRGLGDRRDAPEQPQLSVRLKGSRIELASASEEEQVDFLGPAENIKQLFKLPYSHSGVSLAVHRVGSTLVVDGELAPNELPAGFDDSPQETIKIQQQSLAPAPEEAVSDQQTLLYEKFIYESAMRARPSSSSGRDAPSEAIDKEIEQSSSASAADVSERVQPKTRQSKKSKKAKKKAGRAIAQTASMIEAKKKGASSGEFLEDTASDTSLDMIPSPRLTNDISPTNLRQQFADTTQEQEEAAAARAFANAMNPGMPRPFPPAGQYASEESAAAAAAWASPASYDFPTFQRVLKWKFHDLKMILGSQVLLFSNPDHPAVSLRLHDMDQELSLCTVLDYYLDNVIANIPELAICMHSKGLVRGYKLVETRNIPYMSDTGRALFDVQDVSMNASMLLKFLQENCSRPNGTYWLYRKEGESSLRLYDVNVLSQGKQLKWKYMMAMLCYRFAARASRLIQSLASGSPRLQKQLQQRQRDLLSTCMNLLAEIAQAGGTSHSSICASVSEQLADTYIRECEQMHGRADTTGLSENDHDNDNDHAVEALQHAKEHLLDSIISFEACVPPKKTPSALAHKDSVDSMDSLPIGTDRTDEEVEEDEDEDEDEDDMSCFMNEELSRLKLKFSSVCLEQSSTLSEQQMWLNAVDAMLEACRFLPISAIPDHVQQIDMNAGVTETPELCHTTIEQLLDELDFDGVAGRLSSPERMTVCSSGADLRCFLLERIGDMATHVPTAIANHLTGMYRIISGERLDAFQPWEDKSSRSAWIASATTGEDEIFQGISGTDDDCERLLTLAFLAYLRSMTPSVDSELYFLLMKKLGNASNELGKYFSGQRQDYQAAFKWFERGARIFSDIEDGVNVALLYANMSHLHKILARGKDQDARETHYSTAIQLCSDALHRLKQTKAEVELRDKVKGELALTYLVWAVDMAASTTSDKTRENEILRTFDRALILYNELGDAKQAASTHYQIASFYNRLIARELQSVASTTPSSSSAPPGSSTLKNRMEIARRHYEKSLDYFGKKEVGQTFILIHQELADLYAMGGRIEDIEHALLFLLNTYEAFSRASIGVDSPDAQAMAALARDVIAKVKVLLHQLIRRSTTNSGQSAGNAYVKGKKLDMFKRMYKEVIYYDGYSAGGSIVPIMGTLRAMYLL